MKSDDELEFSAVARPKETGSAEQDSAKQDSAEQPGARQDSTEQESTAQDSTAADGVAPVSQFEPPPPEPQPEADSQPEVDSELVPESQSEAPLPAPTPIRPHKKDQARKRKKWRRMAGVGACLLFVGGMVALSFSPLAKVEKVSVSGSKLADSAKIVEALKPLEGKPVGSLNNREITGLLKKFPAIQDVRIQLDGPHDLRVEVVEHRQVAVMERDGKKMIVGDNGVALKEVSGDEADKLPLVRVPEKDPGHQIFDGVVQALAELPGGVLATLKQAEAKSVDTVTFKLRDGRKIVWGGPEDGPMKAALVETFLNQKDVKDKVIDVSTPQRPVTSNE